MSFNRYDKIADIIEQDFKQVLLLEHLGITFIVNEKTVEEICKENNINPDLYLHFAMLFANKTTSSVPDFNSDDIKCIVKYLQNCHNYYLNERANKIIKYVKQISEETHCTGIRLLDDFVKKYIDEIKKHFAYENEIVFPYMISLANNGDNLANYSVIEYKHHHDNIDDKLADIKGLLIKYLPFDDNNNLRRKLLNCLFDLEHDLKIHTLIEDTVLIPLVEKFEGKPSKYLSKNIKTSHTDTNTDKTLSEREIDVLKLLLAGNSNKEVADKLNISTHTVISHRKNISSKTSIKSLAGLTIYAIQNGIIEVTDFTN
ncbi:MAG: hemerythrin domain-containing protein [Paludibacteraceae bacterium]|nr:hemerythrin domain-containing protein [Paludibacteraceae bacterium]